ncbi:MAG: glycosyltransferase [Desulfurococcales archaeon]|nr:glycosyltransferase [Desulfurococcales archaeon]
MRVAYVSTYPPIHCGVGEYTRLLSTALNSASPNVEIIVLAEEGVRSEYVDPANSARVKPSFRARDPASYRGILDGLAELGGVDIIHVQHEYGIYGYNSRILEVVEEAVGERLARAGVVTLHTVNRLPYGHPESIDFQRQAVERADAIIVHSMVQEYELYSQTGGYSRRITRIPHGTMVNPYISTPRLHLARTLGLEPGILGRLIIVLPGFLRPDKGVDILYEALGMLDREARGRMHVIVAGEPRDERLASLAEEGGFTLIPRYLSTDEILMLSALADAIVLPYRDPPGKYAVSGILHLSMGSLKPVLGAATPRLSELYMLAPRLVFKAGDPAGLALRLRSLLDQALYEVLVSYAGPLYSYAVRTGWQRMARRHLNLYAKLLEGH